MGTVKRGFTLIELVVTLAVIGILVAMTSVTIGVMVNLQNSVGNSTEAAEQVDGASEIVREYVSLVSVDTRAKSDGSAESARAGDRYFVYLDGGTPAKQNEISFLYRDADTYKLSFNGISKELIISSPAYSYTKTFQRLESIVFRFDTSILLLSADIKPAGGTTITRSYSLEVLG